MYEDAEAPFAPILVSHANSILFITVSAASRTLFAVLYTDGLQSLFTVALEMDAHQNAI